MNFTMKSFGVLACLAGFSASALACPNCAGSTIGAEKYTFAILGGFILLTYIPFVILFKQVKKGAGKSAEAKDGVGTEQVPKTDENGNLL